MKPIKGWLKVVIIVASFVLWNIFTVMVLIGGRMIYESNHWYDHYWNSYDDDYYTEAVEPVAWAADSTVACAEATAECGISASISSFNTSAYEDGYSGVRIWVNFVVTDRYDLYTRLRLSVWDESNQSGIYYDGEIVEANYYFTPSSNSYSGQCSFFIPYYKIVDYGSGTYTFDLAVMAPYTDSVYASTYNIGSCFISSSDLSR